jgi:hypothetical protein
MLYGGIARAFSLGLGGALILQGLYVATLPGMLSTPEYYWYPDVSRVLAAIPSYLSVGIGVALATAVVRKDRLMTQPQALLLNCVTAVILILLAVLIMMGTSSSGEKFPPRYVTFRVFSSLRS